jgi:hypothetical protein
MWGGLVENAFAEFIDPMRVSLSIRRRSYEPQTPWRAPGALDTARFHTVEGKLTVRNWSWHSSRCGLLDRVQPGLNAIDRNGLSKATNSVLLAAVLFVYSIPFLMRYLRLYPHT